MPTVKDEDRALRDAARKTFGDQNVVDTVKIGETTYVAIGITTPTLREFGDAEMKSISLVLLDDVNDWRLMVAPDPLSPYPLESYGGPIHSLLELRWRRQAASFDFRTRTAS